ncbi:MAG: hypothetical protein QM689_12505 [Oscillospiraceae bacterium]
MSDDNEKITARPDLIDMTNMAISSVTDKTLQRYSAAVKEHLVAYNGIDHETRKIMKKSLKSISKSHVNKNYRSINLKQQAGFSAEVKETARENAERIIRGSRQRIIRTDDIGQVNDPLYDQVKVDMQGTIVDATGVQMKFTGNSASSQLNKLMGKDCEKYLNNDCDIMVPADRYDLIKQQIPIEKKGLRRQLAKMEQTGNIEQQEKLKIKLDKLDQLDRKLKKSRVSTGEAMEARIKPKLSTVKDVGKLAHRGGVVQAKNSARIGGGIAMIKNVVAVARSEKTARDALVDTAIQTGKYAASGYIMGFTETVITGGMRNAANSTVRVLAKVGLPGKMIAAAVQVSDVMMDYFKGEITGTECLTRLGDKGTGMLSSAAFAVAGQILIPIPVVGSVIGGMIGYAFSSSYYGQLMAALAEKKLAHEERLRIEAECVTAVAAIREYRAEMEHVIAGYFQEYQTAFYTAFTEIKEASEINDVDGYISGVNRITRQLGGTSLFDTMDELEQIMSGSEPIHL